MRRAGEEEQRQVRVVRHENAGPARGFRGPRTTKKSPRAAAAAAAAAAACVYDIVAHTTTGGRPEEACAAVPQSELELDPTEDFFGSGYVPAAGSGLSVSGT
jgi:hypothetical protein